MIDLVSIVVPVYNVKPYLYQCINSIIKQDYTNLEIIIVDDGSTDGCAAICDEYAAKDDRIQVVHKTNGGLSSARNAGTKIAKGKYIAFIDSDDWVSEDYISHQIRLANQYKADIIVMGHCSIWEGGEAPKIDYSNEKISEYSKIEALEAILYGFKMQVSACKMFKTELIKRYPFPVGALYEDLGMMYKVFGDAEIVVQSNLPMYYYRRRNGSIINEKFDSRHLVIIDHAQKQYDYIKDNYPQLLKAASYRCAYVVTELSPKVLNVNDKATFMKIRKVLIQHKKDILFNHKVQSKCKIRAFAILCGYTPAKIETKTEKIIKRIENKNTFG